MKISKIGMALFVASMLMSTSSFSQINSPTMYKGPSVNPGGTGSYFGRNITATGAYSFGGGYYASSTGSYSLALGVRVISSNSHSFAFGIDVRSTANRAFVLGSGVNNGAANSLINNIDRSLMVGFNSTKPTLFVGPSAGGSTTGKVGIGTTSTVGKLTVITDNSIGVYAQSTNWTSGIGAYLTGGSRGVYGIAGTPFTTGTQPNETYGLWGVGVLGKNLSCGVHGDGTGESTGYAYGVWGTALGGGLASYGVYGTGAAVSGPFYAGYFEGDVFTTGVYMTSDKKLKENIKPLTDTDRLFQLQAKEYNYKTEEYASMNLSEGMQMGFLAQDVEKVFPNLIKETIQPPRVDKEGNVIEEGTTFKAVNYIGLIPVLTATIQEQEAKIVEQDETIELLEERLTALENQSGMETGEASSDAVLFQNAPNPFNTETVIRYSLPESTRQAEIMIFDMNGTHKETLSIDVSTNGRVVLSAQSLTAGMYIYALVADGKEVSSKKMIITK